MLAYDGSPKADAGKPALLQALKTADDSDKPQIVWALVALKEPAAFKDAMDQYRKGFLSKVERLGGGGAFDPQLLAKLVSLDELAKLAGDESPSVRQLVATVLARASGPDKKEFTDTLIKLVKDKDPEVGREAANGLGKIADDKARGPLPRVRSRTPTRTTGRSSSRRCATASAARASCSRSTRSIRKSEETAWFQTKQIMEMLRDLADPRVGDPLVKWIDSKKPPMHWVGEAGDPHGRGRRHPAARSTSASGCSSTRRSSTSSRSSGRPTKAVTSRAPIRAARRRDPACSPTSPRSMRTPRRRLQLKADAEEPVIHWIKDKPQPHANGLRFLATVGSEKILNDMRDWSFPKKELPKEGQQPPFPSEFETAQSALRYLGKMKDEPSYPKLIDQLKRKKDKTMGHSPSRASRARAWRCWGWRSVRSRTARRRASPSGATGARPSR